jgi:siroheme synthase (precorrin-2 oxidase/ferrochelatase)
VQFIMPSVDWPPLQVAISTAWRLPVSRRKLRSMIEVLLPAALGRSCRARGPRRPRHTRTPHSAGTGKA